MKPLKPMWDDPSEAQSVRELLEAGRGLSATDYDVDKGLADHLAHVAAGTPAPEWAKEIIEGGSGGGATAGATSSAALAAWIAVPIVAAGVVAGVLVANQGPDAPATEPANVAQTHEAAPNVVAPVEVPTAVELPMLEIASPERGRARALKPAKRHAEDVRGTRQPASAVGAKALAPKGGVDELMARPVSSGPTGSTGGATGPTGAQQSAGAATGGGSYARPDDAQYADAEQAPAEDLHAKWARGVNAGHDPAADANDARLEREMRMLKVAQAALGNNPTRALQLARRGEREYGASMFQAERQHVVILALVKLGNLAEARKLAKPYLAKYPRGPFSARVREALVTARASD